jgi:hypothetical protein
MTVFSHPPGGQGLCFIGLSRFRTIFIGVETVSPDISGPIRKYPEISGMAGKNPD